MVLNGFKLFRSQLIRFVQNRVRNANLTNIMELSCVLKIDDFFASEAELFCDDRSVATDTNYVLPRFIISNLRRAGQALDGLPS